jgi:anti-sigma B factor antagonist
MCRRVVAASDSDESPIDPLTIDVDAAGPVAVLRVNGEVDVATADQLRRAAAQLIARCAASRLEVDLSRVQFMDSTGLGALVTARNLAMAKGMSFAVRAPSPNVRRLLEITGLSGVFGVGASSDQQGVPGSGPRRLADQIDV